MRSTDHTLAAIPAANALPEPQNLTVLLAALWLGVQVTARSIFSRRPPTSPNTPGNSTPPIPEARGLPSPVPDSNRDPRRAPTPDFVERYSNTLNSVWREHDWNDVATLVQTLQRCWRENRQVFLCGNGGSAANAIHLANDFLYGIDKKTGRGLRVTALPANAAVLTCLANDIAYEDIFAQQLSVLAAPGDVLIALSGSGNSPNIITALERARELGLISFAVLGFTGGKARALAEHPIYFPVHDMQVAEDLQMMVGHMAMQFLSREGRG